MRNTESELLCEMVGYGGSEFFKMTNLFQSFLFFCISWVLSLEFSGDIDFIPLLFQPFSIPEIFGKHATNRNFAVNLATTEVLY